MRKLRVFASNLILLSASRVSILLGISGMLFVSACTNMAKDPERARLHLEMGTANLNRGNYPAALQDLLTAEKFDPTNPVIQNNLGLAYFVRRKFSLAEEHIQNALDLDPKFTEARNNLGKVYVESGQLDKAIKQFKISADDLTYSAPDRSWSNLGMAYFLKGNFPKAKESLEEALKLNKKDCQSYTFYGRSLYELRDYQPAAESLDRAISFCNEKTSEDSYYYSGLSYYRLGNRERAIVRLEEILQKFPEGKYSQSAQSILRMVKEI